MWAPVAYLDLGIRGYFEYVSLLVRRRKRRKWPLKYIRMVEFWTFSLAAPIDTAINFSPPYITSPTSTHLMRRSISTHLIDIYQGRIENQEFGLISLHLRWKLDTEKIRQIIIRKFKVYCFYVSYYNPSESKVQTKTLHWFFVIDFAPSYIDI